MSKVILDDALRDQLSGRDGSVELSDRAGRTVGYFLSPDEYKKLLYAWAKEEFVREESECPYDADDEGSMTTAELLAYLNGLGQRGIGSAATKPLHD